MPSMSEPSAITGLPLPHVAMNAVGMPATPSSTVKPFFLSSVDEVLRRLELLEAQLAVAEDLIDHLLREVLELLDLGGRFGLELP